MTVSHCIALFPGLPTIQFLYAKKNRREKSGSVYYLTDINTQEGRKEEEPPIERMQFVHALHVPNKWLVVANIQNSI